MEPLRDELYCQLMRQATRPPSRDLALKAWELLACACCSFLPSAQLRPYVAAFFLVGAKSDDPQIVEYLRSSWPCVWFLFFVISFFARLLSLCALLA